MSPDFKVEKVILEQTADREVFYFTIENISGKDAYLGRVDMFEASSLTELGLDENDCVCFRSGRHKNDMPGVFTFGKLDDAMKDAMSGMTESGDKAEETAGGMINSDHLTILGKEGNYVVIAFFTGRDQLFRTDIAVDDQGAFKRLVSQVEFNIRMKAGECRRTETIYIERTANAEDAIERFAAKKASIYGTRNQADISVFCTWYYYGLTVTYEDVKTNLEEMKRRKLPFDVFQLDEGWEQILGEWEANEKFPKPMKELADEIREAGYRPGIWTSPFVAHETASIWKEHPEWKLRDKEGNPCLFPMNDLIYHVLDITHPETWEYFTELYRKLTFDWGYTYHKLDFTRASVIYEDAALFDDTITLAQAYYQAVKAIRKGMGEDSYFLMCGGLYDPIIGLVDAQRTGSDVLSMWSSTINKNGKTAPYTIKQSILRSYMNAWWNNDPDALMVRKNETMERNLRLTYGLLNDEEVKTSTVNQFMSGGLVCSTEPLDKIDDERLYNLRHVMPVLPATVRPIGMMQWKRYPEAVKIQLSEKKIACLAYVNWSDEENMGLCFKLDEDMLPAGCCSNEKFAVCDFYGKVHQTDVSVGDEVKMSTLAPHAATVLKIEPMGVSPIVVESDGHFSMGAELLGLDIVDGQLQMTYNNPFDHVIRYKVMLPEGYVAAKESKYIDIEIGKLAKGDVKYPVNYISGK